MAEKVLYVFKFKGETIDSALKKCGGLKACFKTAEEALESARLAGFNMKDIIIIKVSYSRVNIV